MATQNPKATDYKKLPELSAQEQAERERRIAEILLKIKRRLESPTK